MEIITSLIGAIVGSVITLVYTNWHEKFALEKEKRILQEALLGECQLQMALLERLDYQYAQSQSVNPGRVTLDLFVHALHRHVTELGDVKLISKISQFVVQAKALNAALDRYEPALLKAVADPRWLSNMENFRKGICVNITNCKQGLNEVATLVRPSEVDKGDKASTGNRKQTKGRT